MKFANTEKPQKGAPALGGFGLVIVLTGLITAPAVAQDATSLTAGFSLSTEYRGGGSAAGAPLGTILTRTSAGNPPLRTYRPGTEGPIPGVPARLAVSMRVAGTDGKPPVRGAKIAAEILAGAAVTAAAFGASILTASEYTLDDDEAMRRRAATWYIVGGAGLTPLAVYLIGNSGPLTGSLGKTYLYGAAGGAAGALLLFLAFESDSDALGVFVLAVSALGPAVGAVIGYNSSRRYDPPARVQTALLSVTQGKLRLGIPAPQIFFSGLGRKAPGLAIRFFQVEL